MIIYDVLHITLNSAKILIVQFFKSWMLLLNTFYWSCMWSVQCVMQIFGRLVMPKWQFQTRNQIETGHFSQKRRNFRNKKIRLGGTLIYISLGDLLCKKLNLDRVRPNSFTRLNPAVRDRTPAHLLQFRPKVPPLSPLQKNISAVSKLTLMYDN